MPLTVENQHLNITPNFPVVFKSLFGYNVVFHEGVIYNLKNKSSYIIIMKIHIDLVDLTRWFRIFLKKCHTNLRIKRLLQKIKIPILYNNFQLYRKIGIIKLENNCITFSGNNNIYRYYNLDG